MQTSNPLFDDIARVASGALGAAAGLRAETQALLRERLRRILDKEGLVSREEFEAVRAMAAKARAEQEATAARLAILETELAALRGEADAKARASRRKA